MSKVLIKGYNEKGGLCVGDSAGKPDVQLYEIINNQEKMLLSVNGLIFNVTLEQLIDLALAGEITVD